MENTSQIFHEYPLENNVSLTWALESDSLHAPTLTSSGLTRALVLSLLAFFSLLGNLVTLQNARNQQKGRFGTQIHRIYTLIVQLAISDIFVTIFCMTGEAIWMLTVEWKGGNLLCKIFKFLQMFSLYLSTFIMTLIGIDRFISVRFPLKVLSKELCNGCIGGCWALAILLSLPQLYVFRVNRAPFVESFYQCVTFGAYSQRWEEEIYAIFSISTMFLIPLGILGTSYILTVCTLHQTEEVLTELPVFKAAFNPKRKEIIHRAKIKSLRLSITIIITFLLCWSPYYALMIVSIFAEMFQKDPHFERNQVDTESPLLEWIFFFGMSNSLCNPIIYGIFLLWKPKDDWRSHGGTEFSRARVTRTLPPPIIIRNNRNSRNGNGNSKKRILRPRDDLEFMSPNPKASEPSMTHDRVALDHNCPGGEGSDISPSCSNPEFCREMEQWFECVKNKRSKQKPNGSSLISNKSLSSSGSG